MLKKWKFDAKRLEFCVQKMEISPMPWNMWKAAFSMNFHAKLGNSMQFHAAMIKSKFLAKFHDRGILEELEGILVVPLPPQSFKKYRAKPWNFKDHLHRLEKLLFYSLSLFFETYKICQIFSIRISLLFFRAMCMG